MSTEDVAWLKLSLLTTLPTSKLLSVLQSIGCVEEVFDASFLTLSRLGGEAFAREVRSTENSRQADVLLEWMARNPAVGLLRLTDSDYPQLMIEAGEAPMVLWYRGSLLPLQCPMLAITGSTHPDQEAMYNAENFGLSLGQKTGITLSTGLFPGTEQIFTSAALTVEGCSLVVWQSCGSDRIWPSATRDRVYEILDKGGLLLSAAPPGSVVTAQSKRQQMMCRMAASRALLVLNAHRASALLDMAKSAACWGRDVMAVPGSIHSPLSKGCHILIKQGAKLVETSEEIADEVRKTHC